MKRISIQIIACALFAGNLIAADTVVEEKGMPFKKHVQRLISRLKKKKGLSNAVLEKPRQVTIVQKKIFQGSIELPEGDELLSGAAESVRYQAQRISKNVVEIILAFPSATRVPIVTTDPESLTTTKRFVIKNSTDGPQHVVTVLVRPKAGEETFDFIAMVD